jgi:hypothetical protein
MQGAWLITTPGNGQTMCIPGESMTEASPQEQQVLSRGCEWTGGTCTTTVGGSGGEWICPPGVADQLAIRAPGTGLQWNRQTITLLGVGLIVFTGIGLVALHFLTRGSR